MKIILYLLRWIAIISLLVGMPIASTSTAKAAERRETYEDKIDPELRFWMQERNTDQFPIIVYLTRQADLSNLIQAKGTRQTLTERRQAIVKTLVHTAIQSQKQVMNAVPALVRKSRANEIQSFWIFNGFAATVDEQTIYVLASLPQVARIYPNRVIRLTAPENPYTPTAEPQIPTPPTMIAQTPTVEITISPTPTLVAPSTPSVNPKIEWGVSKIQADRVWKELNVTGEGIVVGTIDSGVMWEHVALKNKYRGWDGTKAEHRYSWFDAVNEKSEPYDDQGHGTHTMGSLVGSTDDGVYIGTAPGARWISAKALDDHGSGLASTLLKAMEWMMAPGGDPAMAPRVVSNSWGARTCEETFRSAVQAWEVAGIIGVFSGGNSGALGESTLGSPACYPEVIGVGATNQMDQVADFSSRGPSPFGVLKPDVCAPGVNVRSSLNNGDYGTKSGTSMATPYVSGVIALILSADPSLSLPEVKEILKKTAVDVGDSGEDNQGGGGRIDAYEAVKTVLEKSQTPTPTSTEANNTSATPSATEDAGETETPMPPTPNIPPVTSTPTTISSQPYATAVEPPTNTIPAPITPLAPPLSGTPIFSTATPTIMPTLTSTQVPEPHVEDVFIDDSDPQLNYSPGWKIVENSSFYKGKAHISENIGSNAALAFEGVGITLVSTYAPSYGVIIVLIDGKVEGKIDLYASQVMAQQKWRSRQLEDGKHWLKLIHYNGTSVNVDAIVVHRLKGESQNKIP